MRRLAAPVLLFLIAGCMEGTKPNPLPRSPGNAAGSLYQRMGGAAGMRKIVDDFCIEVIQNDKVREVHKKHFREDDGSLKQKLREQFGEEAGGPEKYTGKSDAKVAVVAINVNTGKDDALPAMKVRANKKKFNFTYLFDPSQEIARKYGAMFTPEFFVLDRDRRLVYSGAMDNRAAPGEPTAVYLAPAVDSALAGEKPTTAETSAAAGCRIKFNRKHDDD